METDQLILEKVRALPPEKQQKVLDFVESSSGIRDGSVPIAASTVYGRTRVSTLPRKTSRMPAGKCGAYSRGRGFDGSPRLRRLAVLRRRKGPHMGTDELIIEKLRALPAGEASRGPPFCGIPPQRDAAEAARRCLRVSGLTSGSRSRRKTSPKPGARCGANFPRERFFE